MNEVMVTFPEGTDPHKNALNLKVMAIAGRLGLNVYLVGGYLRDALLQEKRRRKTFNLKDIFNAKDLDYAVIGGTALDLAKNIAFELKGHYVELDDVHDTHRVVLPDSATLDFAACIGGKIEEDVLRRDFTVNALVWDPKRPDCVLDLVGGLADLEPLTLRAISESVLVEDPLRLLRAFRFAATLGGTIEPQSLSWITRHAAQLASVKAERINSELFALLAIQHIAPVVQTLAQTGLFEAIFPELTPTRKVTPNAFHHLGLFEHSLEALCQLDQVLELVPEWAQSHTQVILSPGITRLSATKVATLLHDIGKPDTWTITKEGRHKFYGHDQLGSQMSETIAGRLKWSKATERLVTKLIRWHLRPGQLFHHGAPTARALHRFYRLINDDVPELVLLALGDLEATAGPSLTSHQRNYLKQKLLELFEGYRLFKEREQKKIKLLDGDEIMKLLRITPGPVIGDILKALDEAQAVEEISNKDQAQQYVVNFFKRKHGP